MELCQDHETRVWALSISRACALLRDKIFTFYYTPDDADK